MESKIEFQEDTGGYKSRTIKNASADVTIAIASYFDTAGEKLTKRAAVSQGKRYLAVRLDDMDINPLRISRIVENLNEVKAKTLNIAGNGLYTLKRKYTQEQIDDFTFRFLKEIINNDKLENKIELVRTGGQTGVDEAGAKASFKLGIPTLVLAPKGWLYRNEDGEDVYSETKFKSRFDV